MMIYKDLEDAQLHDKTMILVTIKEWKFAVKCRDKINSMSLGQRIT